MSTTAHNTLTRRTARVLFVLTTFGVFVTVSLFLILIDFIPEPTTTHMADEPRVVLYDVPVTGTSTVNDEVRDEPVADATVTESPEREYVPTSTTRTGDVPTHIEIPRIGIDTIVLSPQTTDIDVLDRALLAGAVHYPGSGVVGETANMLIFGHSSYLPVVHNQAFKAFNELSKLETGDVIHVTSDAGRYTYTARSVRLANADEEIVYFGSSEPLLTLATCNTFGAKQERWIVTAVLQERE